MTENQKLRDALRYIEGVVYSVGGLTDCQIGEMLREIQKVASKALSLPTADHTEDSLAMVQAAAPVNERELPPLPTAGIPDDQFQLGVGDLYTAKQMRAYARAALQSGADPKDAERLDWIECQHLEELSLGLVVDADHDGDYFVNGDDGVTHYGKTLREAIDRARGA